MKSNLTDTRSDSVEAFTGQNLNCLTQTAAFIRGESRLKMLRSPVKVASTVMALCALMWLATAERAAGDPLDTWSRSEFNVTGEPLPSRLSGAYGAARFVIPLSSTSTGTMTNSYFSTNGTAWNLGAGTNYLADPAAIAWGNTNFVVVGGGTAMAGAPTGSPGDDIVWSAPFKDLTSGGYDLRSVAYGLGTWMAAGTQAGNALSLEATGGGDWSQTNLIAAGMNPRSLIFNGVKFFVVGDGGAISSCYSNVFLWTAENSGTANDLRSVAVGAGGQLVAVGLTNTILTSTGNGDWAVESSPAFTNDNDNVHLLGVVYGGGEFVAVGYHAGLTETDDVVITSADGTNWVSRTVDSAGSFGLQTVVFGDNRFVALDANGTALASDPVLTLVASKPTTSSINGFTSGLGLSLGGGLVAVGGYGTILNSSDGTNWTSAQSGVTDDLFGAAAGLGMIVVSGANGILLQSVDGLDWRPVVSGVSNRLSGVAFGLNKFVSVGDGGTVVTSTNGSDWTPRSESITNNFSGITFGNGTFLILDQSGEVWLSSDTENWVAYPIEHGGPRLVSITFDPSQNLFTGADDNGSLYTSSDGVNWTESGLVIGGWTSLVTNPGKSVPIFISGDGHLLAGGSDGTILTASWSQKQAPTGGNPLYAVAYGDELSTAVGGSGTLVMSADGSSWKTPVNYPGTSYDLRSVAFGGGRFVAVGEHGTVAYSTEDTNWTVLNLVVQRYLWGVAYGNGVFVAVGGGNTGNGLIMTSTDGVNWSTQVNYSNGGPVDFSSIVWGNGRFVAVGDADQSWVSTDGTNWTHGGAGLNSGDYSSVTFGNGLFVAVSDDSGAIFTSTDGSNWSQQIQQDGVVMTDLYAVSYGDGVFVAGGDNGSIYASADGTNWVQLQNGSEDYQKTLRGISYNGSYFVMVGDNGKTLMAAGIGLAGVIPLSIFNWNLVVSNPSGGSVDLASVAWGNSRFVAVGDADVDLVSTDGVNWIQGGAGLDGEYLDGVAFDDGRFAAVTDTDGGGIFTSTNGIVWTQEHSGSGADFLSVAFGDGSFVAVGYNGNGSRILQRQSNGSWSPVPATGIQSGDHLNSIIYADNQFVAISAGNHGIYTSLDATNWALSASAVTDDGLNGITYGNGLFVAVGSDGALLISSNATDWTAPTDTYHGAPGDFYSVAYGNDKFVAAGSGGWLAVSTDGTNWVSRNSPTLIDLSGIAYGDGRFVAAGGGNTGNATIIATDPFVVPWLSGPGLFVNGTAEVMATATAWENIHFQASTNLLDWQTLNGLTLTNGAGQLFEPGGAKFSRRFYRAYVDP